jgi:hypothetical protein
MRAYLLGTLDEDQRTQLEEEILSDPQIYEELLIAEEELIDQYLAGALSKIEIDQFENHFLITAERQKKLRFGSLLQNYVNSHSSTLQPKPFTYVRTTPAPLSSYSFSSKPVMAFAAMLVAVLGIAWVGWFAMKKSADRTALHTIPPHLTVTLKPGSTGSPQTTPPRVNVAPKGYQVKLELELSNPIFRNYKSELIRANESLQVSDELTLEAKGEQHVVPFTVPGEMLRPGEYQVKLSGVLDSGADEFIDSYLFRIVE